VLEQDVLAPAHAEAQEVCPRGLALDVEASLLVDDALDAGGGSSELEHHVPGRRAVVEADATGDAVRRARELELDLEVPGRVAISARRVGRSASGHAEPEERLPAR
jgi:hypothetical protein